MNVSSNLVRCGVFCTYLFHTPWTMSCASALDDDELGLVDLTAAGEEVAGAVPVEAGTRCFGGIACTEN